MDNQRSFWSEDHVPYQGHSDTSKAAAEEIINDLSRLRRLVYSELANTKDNGLTDEEGIERTHLSPSTYRPRRIELLNLRLIRDSGRRRRVRSGRLAVVWITA